MKKIWMVLGRISFWITWPGIWFIVRITPPRTRVILIHDNKLLITQDWLGAGVTDPEIAKRRTNAGIHPKS